MLTVLYCLRVRALDCGTVIWAAEWQCEASAPAVPEMHHEPVFDGTPLPRPSSIQACHGWDSEKQGIAVWHYKVTMLSNIGSEVGTPEEYDQYLPQGFKRVATTQGYTP